MSAIPPSIRRATRADLPAIVSLINEAFRVESFFLNGDRTNLGDVTQRFELGEFFLAESPEGQLLGCVYLEKRNERAYFGMLSVDPSHKRTGLGRLLIEIVEAHARKQGCVAMDITSSTSAPNSRPTTGASATKSPANSHPRNPCAPAPKSPATWSKCQSPCFERVSFVISSFVISSLLLNPQSENRPPSIPSPTRHYAFCPLSVTIASRALLHS